MGVGVNQSHLQELARTGLHLIQLSTHVVVLGFKVCRTSRWVEKPAAREG